MFPLAISSCLSPSKFPNIGTAQTSGSHDTSVLHKVSFSASCFGQPGLPGRTVIVANEGEPEVRTDGNQVAAMFCAQYSSAGTNEYKYPISATRTFGESRRTDYHFAAAMSHGLPLTRKISDGANSHCQASRLLNRLAQLAGQQHAPDGLWISRIRVLELAFARSSHPCSRNTQSRSRSSTRLQPEWIGCSVTLGRCQKREQGENDREGN